MLEGANVSDLIAVNKYYRLYRKAVTLEKRLLDRYDWYKKEREASPAVQKRLNYVLVDLREFIGNCRLDSNTFISPTRIPTILSKSAKYVNEYVFGSDEQIGSANLSSVERQIVESMARRSRSAMAQGHTFDLEQEIAYRSASGWFFLFNTLTVAPYNYGAIFSSDSTAWKDYIRKADNLFAAAAYGSKRNAIGKDFHSYFGVVEKGGNTGRLHIHVLHAFVALPDSWQDPNYGRKHPVLREISAAKGLWEHGFSSPIAVRYSLNDAYGKLNWRWPHDVKSGQGIAAKGCMAIAGYMTKYINKSYLSKDTDEWRVRKSRNLGSQILTSMMTKLTSKTLLKISTTKTIKMKLNRRVIPGAKLRRAALREIQVRRSLTSVFESAIDARPSLSPLQQWRALTQTKDMSSSLSTTSLEIQTLESEGISEAIRELRYVARSADCTYFQSSTHEGANISSRLHA